MSDLKPITLYSHASGPNPWKVVILLKELSLPYTTTFLDMGTVKQKPYIDINPNGRVPAIHDPNTNITLWESGAILSYLADTYDKSHKLSYDSFPEKYLCQQWLFFQVSGQGPYYGQAAWFTFYHPEKLPSAQERYYKEMERVVMVVDTHLAKNTSPNKYLVGDKCTYADLSFITWNAIIARVGSLNATPIDVAGKYPHYAAWMDGMLARPAVKEALEEKEAEMKKAGH